MKISSWNIAGGRKVKSGKMFDYGAEDLDYFAKQLSSLNADIICLQETHTNSQRSIAKELAKKLGANNIFDSPASPSHIDRNYSLGTAIISKFTFQKTATYKYPDTDFPLYFLDGRRATTHHKNLQIVEFENFCLANTQMLPIHIFGHQYDKGEGANFAKAIENTLLMLKRPVIFCGDFNFDNPRLIYSRLFDKTSFEEALPDVTTRPNKQGEKKRPDHIFYTPEFKLVNSRVIDTQTDHYLCFAELMI